MAKLVSGTYGEALFELAKENQAIDTMLEEVTFVKDVLASNEDLNKLLNHPQITKEEKVTVIENIFKGVVSDEITGLLVIIMEKGRFNELVAIFDYFIARVREDKNIGVAYITSAVNLSDKQKEKLERKLLTTTKYQKFEMNYIVDSSLIGGLIIRIGDRVVDSSIKSRLAHLVKDLQKVQLETV